MNPKTSKQIQMERLRMGFIGTLFGSGENIPLNIAAFVCLMAFIGLFIVWFFPSEQTDSQMAMQLFSSVITAALGFIFGRMK